MKILCVEDHPVNAELVRDLLELGGHTITVVGDAASFRAALRGGDRPDVVLMDVGLPDGDGAALLVELRGDGTLGEVPAIAVTAHVLPAGVERLRAAGFDAVIGKPIDTRKFVPEVERIFREGRAWRGS